MEAFETLWAFQAEDMKADAIANDIKRSPVRQKLEKSRDFILDRQKQYKQIEESIAAMVDRKDILSDALTHSEEQLKNLQSKIEAAPPTSAEEAHAMIGDVLKCRETISQYESEIRRIVKESTSSVQQLSSIRLEAARAKQTFDQLKVEYDKESASRKGELDAQRAKAKELATAVDPALLEEYNTIKKHITPPMVRLLHGQCSGCNTSLPSATLSKIKAGTMVECETCGRMIVM